MYEASTDMSSFKDERSFAAWTGVASGNNESAGKKKDLAVGMVIPRFADSLSKQPKELLTLRGLSIDPNIES
jgi:hypothetical protein